MGNKQPNFTENVQTSIGITPRRYGDLEPKIGQIVRYDTTGFGFRYELGLPQMQNFDKIFPQLDSERMREGVSFVKKHDRKQLQILRRELQGFDADISKGLDYMSQKARCLIGLVKFPVPVSGSVKVSIDSAFAFEDESGIANRCLYCIKAALKITKQQEDAVLHYLDDHKHELANGNYCVVVGKIYSYAACFHSGTKNTFSVSGQISVDMIDDVLAKLKISMKKFRLSSQSVMDSDGCVAYIVLNLEKDTTERRTAPHYSYGRVVETIRNDWESRKAAVYEKVTGREPVVKMKEAEGRATEDYTREGKTKSMEKRAAEWIAGSFESVGNRRRQKRSHRFIPSESAMDLDSFSSVSVEHNIRITDKFQHGYSQEIYHQQ